MRTPALIVTALIGALAGAWCWGGGMVPPAAAPSTLWADEGEGAGDNYLFFPFRETMWVVHRPSWSIRFYQLPESRDRPDEPIIKSRAFEIDREAFPPAQTRFALSERNLSNHLWLLNPVTGKVMFLKARRDGPIEASPLVEVSGGS